MCLAWLLVTAAGGDVVRMLADDRFHGGTRYIPLIAGGVFFYGLSHLASTGLLVKKNMKPFASWYTLSAIISVLLNLLLIPKIGAIGAAAVQCISFAAASSGIMWSSQKSYPLNIEYKLLLIVMPTILMVGLIMSLPWGNVPFLSLCYKLPIGINISLVVFYFVATDWFNRCIEYIVPYLKKREV